ncbi:MAG TPA: mannose-1-phosphate guanylyltransferase/mannose-6-phosphate isomerase, partial [Firmicutes bacterium]|nr:mannose-1-phosphate guanylyltransferase/mannose-6-phosphate isomerase [Bacillota bacterium]
MYAVILAGGSGTRLWPLSREQFPKQYLTLGESERSLFQETVDRVKPNIQAENIIIVTHVAQEVEIHRQLSAIKDINPGAVKVLLEPQPRNTAPAIGLSAWFLLHLRGPETIMAVFPSDHLISSNERFATLLAQGEQAARRYGLVTFGVTPFYPETGYGYIRLGERLDENAFLAEQFVEKPDRERAVEYIKNPCFLWNSGMFVFKVGSLISAYRRYLPELAGILEDIDWTGKPLLERAYARMEPISIDYGIMEKAEGVAVIPAEIGWSDMGSFEAYYQVMPKDNHGNYCRGRTLLVDTRNSLVLSKSRLVGAVGLENLVVVDTDDALLVCPRKRVQEVRELAEALEEKHAPEYIQHRTVHRPWGSFTTLELGDTYQVKRISVQPGKRLSLQSHRFRSEHWVVVRGEALVTIGEEKLRLQKGKTSFIPTGVKHRLENTGEDLLEVIEVQNGRYLGEDDIIRYQDDFGRAAKELTPEQHYQRWLAFPELDPDTRSQLEAMADDPVRICSCFESELVFGTGGMRGVIGPGLNRMNRYIVRRATQGLADYLQGLPLREQEKKVVIAYDTRKFSHDFSVDVSLVLAANGIRALLFDGPRPTPELSFAIRKLGCAAGIVITASHNPPAYNGYKVYGPDGGQAVSPLIDNLVEKIAQVDLFEDVQITTWEEAGAAGLLQLIGSEVDRLYLEAVQSLTLSAPRSPLKVVYTPLHGAGACLIPDLFRESGYIELSVVDEQMIPDPEFSTVKVPNP